jgi:BCCT family betaine/carnitine transporter
MFFGSIGCAIFYNILGNYALHLELSGQFLTTALIHLGKGAHAISGVIGSLPGGHITLFLFTLMSVVFMATTFDSTSYALASCATEKLEAHQEPARWHRLFWAFTLVILPLSLIYIGGLESLKLAVLISALPLIFVYVMMGISLFSSLKNHE